jgi:CO/xanthine dehydrogenase FAD-binding subunit
MIVLRDYQAPKTLEEAWELNKKKANRIIGGMGWLKMSSVMQGTGIDLCALGLDTITETEEAITIPAMVTLRQLETSPVLQAAFGDAVRESVRHIVGVQFRNCATVGGTAWLRAGFSDPLTLFLAMDCTVSLYQGNETCVEVPLEEFMVQKPDNSILTALTLKKTGRKVAYQSFRNTETDFPVLTVAVSRLGDTYRAAIGARPNRAKAVEGASVEELIAKGQALPYGSNLRGSAEYRQALAAVLIRRAAAQLERN